LEELLDTNVREKIDHPRRIGIVGILTACMTGVLGYAGESGAFENIHEIVMIIVIFGIPLLTSFLAIYAAFPKSLDQCKGLTNSIILTYKLKLLAFSLCFQVFLEFLLLLLLKHDAEP